MWTDFTAVFKYESMCTHENKQTVSVCLTFVSSKGHDYKQKAGEERGCKESISDLTYQSLSVLFKLMTVL